MRSYVNVLLMDLRRCICSFAFPLSVIGVVIILLPGIWFDLVHYDELDVLYFFNYAQTEGIFSIYFLMCGLPCCSLFLQDRNNKYINSLVIRTSINEYLFGMIFCCIIVSMIVLYIGQLTFIFVLSFFCPIARTERIDIFYNIVDTATFGAFAKGGFWKYFFSVTTLEALSGAFFSLCGLLTSMKLPNKYVVLASPLIIEYYLSLIFGIVGIPNYLDITSIAFGQYNFGNTSETLIYGVVFSLFLIFIISVCILVYGKKKVQSE